MPLVRVICQIASFALGATLFACHDPSCGPAQATVARVVDGDTVVLESGERVRYLLVDAPELSTGSCYAAEAKSFNAALVAGRRVTLRYDTECTDDYGRLLAYVAVDGREVNHLLVERGHACVFHIPPNGRDRIRAMRVAEEQAAQKDVDYGERARAGRAGNLPHGPRPLWLFSSSMVV